MLWSERDILLCWQALCIMQPEYIFCKVETANTYRSPQQMSALICDQNDSWFGCKERLLWSSGQKCIIWDRSWLALALYPYTEHEPVYQWAQRWSKGAIIHAVQNMNALTASALQLCSVFFFFLCCFVFHFFLFRLVNDWGFGMEFALKIWQRGLVTHMDLGCPWVVRHI